MRTLGVLGTMVWDRIVSYNDGPPVEGWGGIAYALEAAEAALPADWRILPLIKVGRDLADEAHALLATLPRVDATVGVRVVDEPNNRVELRYLDADRRVERLTGGVPGWSAEALAPLVRQTDALYINFISGAELDLDTMNRLRRRYDGPIYADLHSLLLDIEPDGRRTPRRLSDGAAWLRSFDAVQVNEDELARIGPPDADPWTVARSAVADDGRPRMFFTTLGPRGAAYVEADADADDPMGPVHVPVDSQPAAGDPTGCGDVWGATCFARWLAGDDVDAAVRRANAAAAHNVERRGAAGLHRVLAERVES